MSPTRALQSAILTVLLPLALLTGCHKKDTSGLTHVRLQTDWYPQPEHGGFYTAQLKGYYKAEGLDVEILPGGPYVAGSLIATGQVQFGMDSSDHVLESIANAGMPIIAVAATMQHDPQGLMVRADSPVKSWPDLNGHTVAVKPGSTWWAFLVHKYHLDGVREIPASFSVANFIQDPTYIQQAFITSEPYFAAKGGAPARMLLNRDAGYDPYRVYVANKAFAQRHPDVVARFVRASIHGWKDYIADPTATNALIEKLNPALSPDWANYSYQTLKSGNFVTGDDPTGAQTGQMDAARWTTEYHQLRELGVIKKDLDPTIAYTTTFLKK